MREDVRRDFWGERTFSFYEDAAQLKFNLTNQHFSRSTEAGNGFFNSKLRQNKAST